MRRPRILALAWLFGGLVALPAIAAGTGKWPAPEPGEYTYQFKDASKAALRMSIQRHVFYKLGRYWHYGPGERLYWIECHRYDFDDDEFAWSGDFECRLISRMEADGHPNLLTDNPHMMADWDSRGRFLSEELYGECAFYPEYGAVRHFKLRGMKITLEMFNMEWVPESLEEAKRTGKPQLASFEFRITVEPDKKATSSIAELPEYEAPSNAYSGSSPDNRLLDCSKVIRRKRRL